MDINLLGLVEELWPYYLLVFVRMSGLFLLSPIFGRKSLPNRYKIGFALLLTYLVSGIVEPDAGIASLELLPFVIAILKEFILGLIFGYITLIFLSVGLVAGKIIDVEMGWGAGNLFDPQMEMPTAISGTFMNMIILLYFLINDGHLRLIQILSLSVHRIPIGQVRFSTDLAGWMVEQFIVTFGLAFSLMMPFIASALLTETAFGILMKAMPQINAYIVGMPMKILLGMTVIYLILPVSQTYTNTVFNHLVEAAERIVILMGVT